MLKFKDTLSSVDYLKWLALLIVSVLSWSIVVYESLRPSPWDDSVKELEATSPTLKTPPKLGCF